MRAISSIDRHLLEEAKAFLCWDTFHDLSIQLIPLTEAVGYFLPPTNDRRTILLFYRPEAPDYAEPLFLLFHEAGHALQYDAWVKADRIAEFHRMMDETSGTDKSVFEAEAWTLGRGLLGDFLRPKGLNGRVLSAYDRFAAGCLETYGGGES